MKLSTVMAAAVLGMAPVAASATTVYTQDFEAFQFFPVGWTGPGAIVGVQAYPSASFGSQFLQNDSTGNPAGVTKLTLVGLAPHTTVDLSFDFADIDSWDGGDNTSTNPNGDIFNVKVDGTSVFSESFRNQFGPPATYAGPSLIPTMNYGFSGYLDGAYHISLTGLAHTGSTLTIEFFASGPGWQGGSDESWAIDNVVVGASGTPVPTPAAFAGGAVLAGLMAVGRRRKV